LGKRRTNIDFGVDRQKGPGKSWKPGNPGKKLKMTFVAEAQNPSDEATPMMPTSPGVFSHPPPMPPDVTTSDGLTSPSKSGKFGHDRS